MCGVVHSTSVDRRHCLGLDTLSSWVQGQPVLIGQVLLAVEKMLHNSRFLETLDADGNVQVTEVTSAGCPTSLPIRATSGSTSMEEGTLQPKLELTIAYGCVLCRSSCLVFSTSFTKGFYNEVRSIGKAPRVRVRQKIITTRQ